MPKDDPYFGDMANPKPLLCFLMSMLLELYVVIVTGILFFFYEDMESDYTAWYVWSGSYIACTLLFWTLSYINAPSFKKALGAYFKMDHVTPNLWTVSISYGYLMLNKKEITFIKVFVVALHPIVLWSLFSNLRVNLLHLPWTLYTMGIYRFCRYGCILCVVTFQVVGQTKGISNIAYFVTYLGLQTGLLSLVHFEGYLPVKAKRKEKIKKAAEGGDEELSSRNSIEKKNNRNNELMMPLITDGD